MPYPRHLVLEEDRLSDLASWIETELTNHLSERNEWVAQLMRYQQDYNATPSTEIAKHPFIGASTIIVPLTAIAVEATYARTTQTMFAMDQKIAATVHTDDAKKVEVPLEKYMNQELFGPMNFRKSVEGALLDIHKLGTGVATAEYEKMTRRGVRTRNGEEEKFEVIVKEGPVVSSVPLANFLMPFDNEDTQNSRWCGEVFWLTPNEVKQRERDGFFQEGTYESLGAYHTENINTETSAHRQALEEQTKRKPNWPERVEFYKIYTSWDVSEMSWGREICFIYHRDSRSIVAIWNNWFEDLRRPYRKGVYFPLEHRWPGIGIGQQCQMFQQAMTAINRQRIDNGTIANLRMFKINRAAVDITDEEPLFPGKLWFLDNMDDVQTIEMGDVKVSSYNNENALMMLAQQRNGVTDLTLGMPQAGTPGTATDSASRVQESARKFDFTYSNCRIFADELIADTLCNIVQFGPNKTRLSILDGGSELELFLRQPYEMFRNQVYVLIGLVGQNQNQVLDRQNATMVAGVLQQYYTNMLTLAQQLQDPSLVTEAAHKAMEGANEALLQILPLHNIRNPQKFLITLPSQTLSGPTIPAVGGGAARPSGASSNVTVNNSSVLAPGLESVFAAQAQAI